MYCILKLYILERYTIKNFRNLKKEMNDDYGMGFTKKSEDNDNIIVIEEYDDDDIKWLKNIFVDDHQYIKNNKNMLVHSHQHQHQH